MKSFDLFWRRRAANGSALFSAGCLAILLASVSASPGEPATLKAAYAHRFDIGAAIPCGDLSDAERLLLVSNFTNVTSENCLKPRAIEPEEGVFTFEKGDAFVEFARKNGLKVNGHTLLWHESCPDWFFLENGRPAGREVVLRRMRNHVETEAAHFRGKVASWDVVNEALCDGPGYLRQSKWLACIGEDYLAEAFLAAQKGDPGAELYYNDYGIEAPAKREKTLRLIRELKAKHVRLDGVGIQGHWSLDKIPFRAIEDAIEAFHAEGLKVMITELDIDMVPRKTSGAEAGSRESGVDDPYVRGCPAEVLRRQADQYGALFALFRKHAGKIARVTFWGLHDGRSWLNTWPRKRTNHPLLWGRDLEPKPALGTVLAGALQ